MGEDELRVISKNICDHFQQRHYKQKRLDILNGFELVLTRCINCHRVLNLEARRIKITQTISNNEKLLAKLTKSVKNLFSLIIKFLNNLSFFKKY
jgi:hypothetical protein